MLWCHPSRVPWEWDEWSGQPPSRWERCPRGPSSGPVVVQVHVAAGSPPSSSAWPPFAGSRPEGPDDEEYLQARHHHFNGRAKFFHEVSLDCFRAEDGMIHQWKCKKKTEKRNDKNILRWIEFTTICLLHNASLVLWQKNKFLHTVSLSLVASSPSVPSCACLLATGNNRTKTVGRAAESEQNNKVWEHFALNKTKKRPAAKLANQILHSN